MLEKNIIFLLCLVLGQIPSALNIIYKQVCPFLVVKYCQQCNKVPD